ncbi:MAG: YqeG family HAD IIIA-type phosphatase [Defluviitaleaceae bacterium]|nr:YqeG family HAD IIIA-type phosphatase [Defluviitaleaceae bacterium]
MKKAIINFFDRNFFPDQTVNSVFEIDYDAFYTAGVRGVIFDIDNTLATFDVEKPCEKTTAFLRGLVEKGFKVGFLSNNSKKRVKLFNEDLGYPSIWRAKKPRLYGLWTLTKMMGLTRKKVILVGDQIFTDCWVGNRAGIYTILTKRVADRDEWQVKLKRVPEKIIMHTYKRSGYGDN